MLNYKQFFLSTQAQRIPRFLDLTYILCKLQTNTLPGWTGFNATVQVELLLRSTIGYLQIIDSSSTSYDTVNTILHKSLEICGKLGLEEIVVVFDQAIYAKAQQIRWHNPECSKRIFIRLGDFHTAISYLSCIGENVQGCWFGGNNDTGRSCGHWVYQWSYERPSLQPIS